MALLITLGRRVAYQVILHIMTSTPIILMLCPTTAPFFNYVTIATWAIGWPVHRYEQCGAWSARKLEDGYSFHRVKVEDNQKLYVWSPIHLY